MGRRRCAALVTALVLLASLAAGCTTTVTGIGSIELTVQGASGSAFDAEVTSSLSAVIGYWTRSYPRIADGATLPALKGKLYSVDGDEVVRTRMAPSTAQGEQCLQRRLAFIIDNAAYCPLDDSVIWDRAPDHLLAVLSRTYGPALTTLVFAHEFGHAIQQRLHPDQDVSSSIAIESQADCAAGAFAAAALAGQTEPLRLTPGALDRALVGFLQIRDSTPDSPADISHGDGFDRLNAIQQGIQYGPTYCFSDSYLTGRTYTERGYVSDNDYLQGGNEPLAKMLLPDTIVADLNRFWASAASAQGKSFDPVRFESASTPQCGASTDVSQFGYCPDDNTVYYDPAFAHRAYYSITVPQFDHTTGAITLHRDQPGDYALGMMMATAWGMAARHQLDNEPLDSGSALTAAICDGGAYTEDINRSDYDSTHKYILSPPDMDEATSAVLSLVDLDQAFGARGTTALQRVQAFVTGYTRGLSHC